MKKVLSLFAGLLIFSGLPLIGWGLRDLNGFVENPIRLTFIIMMAVLSIGVVLFVPNEGRGYAVGTKTVKRQKLSLLFLQIVPPLVLLISPFTDHQQVGVFNECNFFRMIGIAVSFIGFVFMNWSIIILGKQFSVDVTIRENHVLITNGPYAYIRHPRYLGIIVFFIGIPLVFLSWVSLSLTFSLVIVLLWRIGDEEKLMHDEFKQDWEDYKKRTYSLIPFIY
jgi:protein-S-isoprenylcysteine O-methyltransferase Ste14